ncbi:MAG: PepSY-like domain-containing protein [Rikenellaceae bacterium]|nr:PepSY-like domain-containing protein [Rikenellaceae bacterium]
MKKFILMILSVVLFQNISYADSERLITVDKLPVAAQKFLKTHFADQSLTYAKVDGYMFDVDYEVRLADGTKIDFDRKGNWTNVERKAVALPEKLVPTKIAEYVAKHYAGSKVVKIERNKRSFEVELSNGLELTFDTRYNLINVDD